MRFLGPEYRIPTMKDILFDLDHWLAGRESVALATVVQTWGSSPRGVGAKMAITPGGKIAGSVSGGCVEGAVYETGVSVLKTGRPELLHFGVADETAWSVGLACGGQIDIFVQPLEEALYAALRKALLAGRPFTAATIIRGQENLLGHAVLVSGDRPFFSTIPASLEQPVIAAAQKASGESRSQRVIFEKGQAELTEPLPGPFEVFVEVVEPNPVLIVIGAVHSAIALTRIARVMGFRTVVIDPRQAFGSSERFPEVDQLIQKWPDEAFQQVAINEKTAIAILTHDPKIDDPALMIVLRSPAFYIGALGSATTQAKRRARLLEAGISKHQLARLHGPIGLKIGSSTPEEIGLAVMAEIIAVKNRAAEKDTANVKIGRLAHERDTAPRS